MASLIHEIENNEALLLLFVSGELPAEDRAEVEQMLAGDAGLRDELSRLATAYDFAMDSLASLDADRTAIAGENHAVRQAKRAMKQWQSDRLHRQPAAASVPARKIPGWAYGSAVAAMLLIGTLTYWGIVGDSANAGGTVAVGTTAGSGTSNGTSSAPGVGPASPITGGGDDSKANVEARGDSIDHLVEAEAQAKVLVASSDSSAVASSILLDDNAH